MISLSDQQLAVVMDAARGLRVRDRDAFLRLVANWRQRHEMSMRQRAKPWPMSGTTTIMTALPNKAVCPCFPGCGPVST